MGYTIGVIGDGSNDAIAMKNAHIGICLGGEESSNVAKEFGDIIIKEN